MEWSFYYCTNLVNAPDMSNANSLTNMASTFENCNNLVSNIIINSENIINAINCFNNTSLDKNVYIPFIYDNSEYTLTYNSFINAGYTNDPENRVNGVLLLDYQEYVLRDWSYTVLTDGRKKLYNYLGSDVNIIVPSYKTLLRNHENDRNPGPFYNKQQFISVDLNNVPFGNNNMSYAFVGCEKLKEVIHINNNVNNMHGAFINCYNLVNAPVIPNSVTSMYMTFYNCYNLVNAPVIPNSVINMYGTFNNCTNLVNAPEIPNSVTNMYMTFYNCTNLVNVPVIPNSVTVLSYTFASCHNLVNAPVIPNSVINMYGTFSYCINLVNAPEIPNSVINMYGTFDGCQNLVNAPEIPNSVTVLSWTFASCHNIDINTIHIPNSVTVLSYTFASCHNLVNIPEIPNSVTVLSYTFASCHNLVNANVIANSVTSMSNTFNNCSNLVNVIIPNTVTDMENTFAYCTNLVNAPVIPNSVTKMNYTFSNCQNLVNAPVIPNSVIDMYYTFENCTNLVNVPEISNGVTDMYRTFSNCISLENAPVIPNSVIDMYYTFENCTNLVNVPEISNGVTDMSGTFSWCESLVNAPEIPNNVEIMHSTFTNCSNLTGNIYIWTQKLNTILSLGCFSNTFLPKNVYIPFTYENNVNTSTYNLFNQYYGSGQSGVTLYDITPYINFNITPNNDTIIYLNKNQKTITRCQAIKNNEYILYNENYPIIIGHLTLDYAEEYTLTKDLTLVTGYTITLNVDQLDCNVTFDINGVMIPAIVNGNNYSITLNTDEEISIGYIIEKDDYSSSIGTLTFNNSNITENITMTPAVWMDWTRPNLTGNGVLGGDSFAVTASSYTSREQPYMAVDNNSSSYWSSSGSSSTYTIYNPNKLKITQLILSTLSGTGRIITVTINGSNDNINWENITSSYSGTSTVILNMSSNTKGFKYYKLTLTGSRYCVIKNIEFTAQVLQ